MLVFVSVCVYNNILRITTCFYKNSTFQVVCLRQACWSYVAPSSVLSVYYDKICIKFASHRLLLYVVYMCQKSLNFTYAFKCYQQNVSGFTSHIVFHIKNDPLLNMPINLANVDRFSKSFHLWTRQWFCNELIIKDPITP